MRTKKLFSWIAIAILLAMFSLLGTTIAKAAPAVDQASCTAIAEGYGNVAHPEDPAWVDCFVAGWVNWVFGTENGQPLPAEPPQAVLDALQHGLFVQLTEPWNAGCNNTLKHPDCSIGYLDLFSDWKDLRAFLAIGQFEQAGVMKDGPWSIGSLWMAEDFVQVARGDNMPEAQMALFCDGALGLAFANDGEYPLPSSSPCIGDDNVYQLWESWRGGCIGDEETDTNCNVGQLLIYEDWDEMMSYLSDNDWTRGGVWANSDKLVVNNVVVQQTATPMPTNAPAATATARTMSPTPTPPSNNGDNQDQGIPLSTQILILVVGLLLLAIVIILVNQRNRSNKAPRQGP